MRSAELFAGYGGLALAVEHALGAQTAWVAEWEDAPSRVLAAHWDAPNYRDVTTINWAEMEPVDIISGGSPCQDISAAGKRAGMTEGTRSNLWVAMREAIATIRPGLVVWENVRGAYSAGAYSELESSPGRVGGGAGGPVLRALGRVLGDLASLGYDAQWRGIRASDVGAPHQRFRVFVLAHRADAFRHRGGAGTEGSGAGVGPGEPGDAGGLGGGDHRRGHADPYLSTPRAAQGAAVQVGRFGPYAPAIARWERVLGRPAPHPTEPGVRSGQRLSPRFVEWMMGLPEGWVTDQGLTRTEALKCLGNGVVPQQATAALAGMARNIERKS